MKLNFGRRLVLFVHWLLSLAGCALAVALIIWPEYIETAVGLLSDLPTKIYAIAVLVVYLIFAVGALCIIFGGRKHKEKNAFITVDSSETGHTRIAVSAVNQMIRQAVRGVAGVAEMRADILNNGDSIAINADVAIHNGTHVPTVTRNIQRAIQGYIEQNCGVAVRGVHVSVHSLTDPEETGKRGRKKKTEVYNDINQTPVANQGIVDSCERPAADFAPQAPAPAVEAPSFEPAKVDLPADEEIALTLDPQPADEPPAEAEPIETPAPEAPAEEPAVEAPAEEPAPAERAPKKGLFGKLFGRRSKAEPAPEPAPAEEPAPVEEPISAEETAVEEPAAEADAETPAAGDGSEEA